MKRISPILAALMIAVTVSAVAVTGQPAFSAQDAEKTAPPPPTGPRMMLMHRGMGGPMGPMGMMPMMEMMHNDPKLAGRIMELRGEIMVTMGQALIKRGKELQQGK